LVKLCETLEAPVEDPEYVGPYYQEFRELVFEAARMGRSLGLEAR
jgi:hypothetical protein